MANINFYLTKMNDTKTTRILNVIEKMGLINSIDEQYIDLEENIKGILKEKELLSIEIEFILNMLQVIEEENPPLDNNEDLMLQQVKAKLSNLLND